MIYYPVIIPTLNRYQHFKECVESLSLCTHADKTELVIGLDYPPEEKYVDGWSKIKEYIPKIKGFAKVTFFEYDHNLGPTGNFSFLIKYVLKKYDAWIETEDDNVFSPCFLDYMDKCLEKYKDDEDILNICAFILPSNYKLKEDTTILRLNGALCAWGMGRWKKAESELLENVPNGIQKKICSDRKMLKALRKKHLAGLHHIIFWANKSNLDCLCDYTARIYMDLNNKASIYPNISLVRNNGNDGSGVNCVGLEDDWVSKISISDEKTFDIIDNLENETVVLNSKIWHEDENSSLSKKDVLLTILYYHLYIVLGYNLTQKLLLLKQTVKKSIFRIKNSILTSISKSHQDND